MRNALLSLSLTAMLAGGWTLLAPRSLHAAGPARKATPAPEKDAPEISLLDGLKRGTVAVKAEGLGDGRMTLSVTNRTKHPLRVVLPPGLIASGATGQFGGMGGMGGMGMMGGMGGMGMMGGMGGGMMGGMGGGMGMMGGMGGGMGGMGGMGGGMGGMGGGMGGGMMGGGTMPASMGMMMLGRLIMSLCGEQDSWDQRSLMSGMMMGMGGMMGGMGGGMMGGMGGGMMGGMGMGMRSVPPTDLPSAILKPNQTRHLPTRLVGLSNPDPEHPVAMPEKGEPLEIGDISQATDDASIQKALKRLAVDKAPITVAQLVLWRLAAGLDWSEIERFSKPWANPNEVTLARQFVEKLGELPEGESGALLYQVTSSGEGTAKLALELHDLLKDKFVLGLKAKPGVPTSPEDPAVACRIEITGSAEKPEARIQVATSNADARTWVVAGKFTLPVTREGGKVNLVEFAGAFSEGVLERLVRAQLSKGPVVKGKLTYKIRIDNASPLVLNGLAILGEGEQPKDTPKVLAGICISPRKSMTVPATGEMVERLGLKKGVKVIAVDLSGL